MAPSDYDIAVTKDFIREVRKHECLYNINIQKNLTLRELDNIWLEVIQKCRLKNRTVKNAKAKWSYLTRQYKKGLQNPKEKSNYHDELDFLNPFVQQIDDVEDDETELSTNREAEEDENRVRMRENFHERPTSSLLGTNNSRIARLSNENRPSTSLSRQLPFNDPNYTLMPVSGSKESMQIDDTEDELHPFFLSCYMSTKKLQPQLQKHVKYQIFKIIIDAEMKVPN
ncbi:hypothetical protein KQX54_015523 [Cotesia glomerata]|uniref:MADF domain-containing protein n=1 Tax=Cotesia glomerata TaxID=32391 RepID=A0AAV7I443_COTGL|nr:hypothetical protein KQX54_015523 [Cotesia glomerata]